jgi:hypothetical protein
MRQPRDDRQDDLFRPALEEIINLYPLVRLAGEIDWNFLARRFSSVCRVGAGQPFCGEVVFRHELPLIARRSRAGASGWVRSRSPPCCRRASRWPTALRRSTPKISSELR